MRVLHVLYQSTPHQSGSTTRSSHLLRSQELAGIEVEVITVPFQAGLSNESPEEIDGVKHHRTMRSASYIKGFSNAGAFKKLIKLLTLPIFVVSLFRLVRRVKPDVIHAHAMFYCAFAALIVGRLCRVPTVYEVRSIWYENSHAKLGRSQRSLARLAERFVLRWVDAVVVISDGIKKNLTYPRPDASIIGNAIFEADIDFAAVHARTKRIADTKPAQIVFGYIGSVIELEGLDALLAAGAMIEARGYKFRLEILGSGDFIGRLQGQAKALGLTGVAFRGRVGRAEVSAAYGEVDCVVNFRRNEAVAQMVTPLKPIEALSFGVPVIASDVNGIRELIPCDGCGVIYVPAGNVELLAQALQAFIHDRSGVPGGIERGLEHVVRHRTWEANGAAFRSLYEHLCRRVSSQV